jgi:hypothetical protein
MSLDIEKIAKDMLAAGWPILRDKAPEIGEIAEGEFKKIAQTLGAIASSLLAKKINEAQARILIDMQRSATRAVLLMAAGLSLLIVEASINAALDVVRAAVNGVVTFALV